MPDHPHPSRRLFLASSLAGLAVPTLGRAARAAETRNTDVLRLTWGYFGLTPIAKERGALEA
jgi:sulfonate transport system substrate-binding protein